jgi:hypothetical protein
MARPKDLGLEYTLRKRSQAEGESRSAADKAGGMKADLARTEGLRQPRSASVSSDEWH